MGRNAPGVLSQRGYRGAKKPTRRELLAVITECQNLFGAISGAFADTNKNRAADIVRLTKIGFEMCVEARSFDPPTT